MSHGRRLLREALLFSWSHERARSNPSQHLLVPRKERTELRADIGSLFLGHPLRVYVRPARASPSLPRTSCNSRKHRRHYWTRDRPAGSEQSETLR